MVAVPSALYWTFETWKAAGGPAATASSWKRLAWTKQGVPVPAELTDAPIDRDIATDFARRMDVSDFRTVSDAFVVSMIWGHGTGGTGAYRTYEIMKQPNFEQEITRLCEIAARDGGPAAYEHVSHRRSHDRGYLRNLGPSFGTKVIYFITRAGTGEISPILDNIVQKWFASNAAVDVAIGEWTRPGNYRRYVDTLHKWGNQLEVPADTVEHLIFAQQNADDGRPTETWTIAMRARPELLLKELWQALELRGLGGEARSALTDIERLLSLGAPSSPAHTGSGTGLLG